VVTDVGVPACEIRGGKVWKLGQGRGHWRVRNEGGGLLGGAGGDMHWTMTGGPVARGGELVTLRSGRGGMISTGDPENVNSSGRREKTDSAFAEKGGVIANKSRGKVCTGGAVTGDGSCRKLLLIV